MNAIARNGLAVLMTVALTAGSIQSARAVNLQDGLISYWTLGEGSGPTAGDTGPAGAIADDGTLVASPAWISGQFNAGMQFDGVGQHVLVPASTDMDLNSSGVTLSAWVKLDQMPADLTPGFGGIFDSQPDNYVMYLDKGNNELRFKATTASGGAERPGVPAKMLDTSDWHHVMGVFDGSDAGANRIYFDGQLIDVHSSLALQFQTVRAGQVSTIGAQVTTDPPHEVSNAFPGAISDVAVWNRTLGLAEAQYLYNSGTGNAVGAANPNINPLPPITPVKPTAQPVVYYNFDNNLDNHGTGGASFNATLHDAPGVNDALYTPTTFGQGLDVRENPISTNSEEPAVSGDYLSVDYTLTDSGTIATQMTVDELYNFQTLWGNSSHGNDWEGWIYGDGRFAARADRTTPILAYNIFLSANPTGPIHYAYTWERDGDELQAKIYIDGEFQGQIVDLWRDPGSTLFIAGGTGNHLGAGIYDEFRIYSTALSEAEILYLSQNAPETELPNGDHNGDGKVDAADYVFWRDFIGTTEGYTAWKDNFGGPSGNGTAANVPEPSTLALGLLVALIGCLSMRKQR